ncbi:MAG: hypothetical protein WCP35_21200 [Verrucomicrobiota bacterium]
MTTIPVSAIIAARKLLTRIHFERLKLPVLTHVLATIDAAGLTLAVTDLDHWLETRLPASIDRTLPDIPRSLIPATALAAAARGDKGSSVQFECPATADPEKPVLKLTVACGKMPVESVINPTKEKLRTSNSARVRTRSSRESSRAAIRITGR